MPVRRSLVQTSTNCNDLFVIACALRLQVHVVIFCLLFIIPPRRHSGFWDDPSSCPKNRCPERI